MEYRKQLNEMPFDKAFETENGNEELCHATGFEVCDADKNPDLPQNWWNEYVDMNGNLYYGR